MTHPSALPDKALPTQFFISTFYHFVPVESPEDFKLELKTLAADLGITGLVIVGPEGFNTTSSASSLENLETWKNFFIQKFHIKNLNNKESTSPKPAFTRFSVKVRPEIVTAGREDLTLHPDQVGKNHHLTPAEWDRVMKEERDQIVVIDTRNWYEYDIGTFKGALNPNIDKFTDFPEYFRSQNIEKDKKILIFCTGGIRCEKGILELQEQGFENVYQLEGGILKYLEEKPNEEYEGECFVFDNRVALDQNLQPSEIYKFCPHCGQPAAIKKDCVRCDTQYHICEKCVEIKIKQDTCSKNCAHQWEVRPNRKGPHQVRNYT